jgi:hypothetical protein
MAARIECSVWTNGRDSWGVRILGGLSVRQKHFHPQKSPVLVLIDGIEYPFNVAKHSFWTSCGELIGKPLATWKRRHGLRSGTRVWLEVLQPQRRFLLNKVAPHLVS